MARAAGQIRDVGKAMSLSNYLGVQKEIRNLS
jgi:hypothetical protein